MNNVTSSTNMTGMDMSSYKTNTKLSMCAIQCQLEKDKASYESCNSYMVVQNVCHFGTIALEAATNLTKAYNPWDIYFDQDLDFA